MIEILIAVGHRIIREGLTLLVEASGGMRVVAEAGSGPETLEKARAARPEVVLLDLCLPGQAGLETLQELKRRDPRVRVLILTAHPEDYFAVRSLKEGADGYLTQDVAGEQLLSAIRKVYAGGKYVSPTLAEWLAFSLESRSGGPPHEALSAREFAVLCRLGAGKTIREIAAELHLSVKTISTYRTRLFEKMNMRSNAELIRYVVEQGLMD